MTNRHPFSCDKTRKWLLLSFKNTEEEEEEQATATVAANEKSMDIAVVTVLSELDGTFTSQEQRLKAFLSGEYDFALL